MPSEKSLERQSDEGLTIYANDGTPILISPEDFRLVAPFAWFISAGTSNPYARTAHQGKTLSMHRLIMGEPDGDVDHANGNTLDNRRSNLRVCSRSQNQMNAQKLRGKTPFRGVYYCTREQKWVATGSPAKGQKKQLGRFNAAAEAAIAYDIFAVKFYGEFANTNFDKRCYKLVTPDSARSEGVEDTEEAKALRRSMTAPALRSMVSRKTAHRWLDEYDAWLRSRLKSPQAAEPVSEERIEAAAEDFAKRNTSERKPGEDDDLHDIVISVQERAFSAGARWALEQK